MKNSNEWQEGIVIIDASEYPVKYKFVSEDTIYAITTDGRNFGFYTHYKSLKADIN